jgi:hypothetical protein
MRRIETEDWWDDLVDLKDDLSLRELSARFNVTPGAISNALRRNHLVRKAAPSGPRAYRPALARLNDQDLPPEAGETSSSAGLPRVRPGSKDYLLQPAFHLLGKIPDAEVARRCAVSVRTVASYRARHHIPGYTGPRKKAHRHSARQHSVRVFQQQNGPESGNGNDRWAGVAQQAARQYGASRGASVGTGLPAVGQATPNAVVVEYAWLVRFSAGGGDLERVLIGTRLTQVATTAAGLGLGDVLSVVRVGPLHSD